MVQSHRKTGDLVICTNNDCSLVNSGNSTPGYYITKNDSYVQCRNYGYCEKINNMSIPSNCNENNIGKLVEVNNEIKLCLALNDDIYLIQHTSSKTKNIFTFDKTTSYYTVRSSLNHIIFDISVNREDYVALVTDGKLLKITMDVQFYDKVVFFVNVLDIP
ncbi:hypothetical protein H8356DRAFT_1425516 [Neocallimastix lanati (nom. inval.)]|nr:hypothetical protein H8356DRAFT_1425516 [Neocallimastix sp. JGI-2020a]